MDPNKVALVTGSASGIGAAISRDLAAHGVRVVMSDVRPEPLAEVAEQIRGQGGTVLAVSADVTDFEAMSRVVDSAFSQWGRLDLVVPNAALHDASSVHDGDPVWWRKVIDTNVFGLLCTVRAAMPRLLEQGSGHVIVIASLSGRRTYIGEPVYVASKHAQVAFADCLRQEVAPRNIKVSVIEPGLVDTPFTDNPVARELKKSVPPLSAEDVARAVRFVFEQPSNVVVNEVALRPAKQLL